MTSLFGESRGGTPEGERIPKGMRAVPAGTEVAKQRFPAFRFLILFPFFLRHCRQKREARLRLNDPAIHAVTRLAQSTGRLSKLQGRMDYRVKPGNDERECRCLTSLAVTSDAPTSR